MTGSEADLFPCSKTHSWESASEMGSAGLDHCSPQAISYRFPFFQSPIRKASLNSRFPSAPKQVHIDATLFFLSILLCTPTKMSFCASLSSSWQKRQMRTEWQEVEGEKRDLERKTRHLKRDQRKLMDGERKLREGLKRLRKDQDKLRKDQEQLRRLREELLADKAQTDDDDDDEDKVDGDDATEFARGGAPGAG